MVQIKKQHVIGFNPAQSAGLTTPPWIGVHLHSTGNPTSQMSGERSYMGRNYANANYTHLVGWNPDAGRPEAWEIMPKGGAYDCGGSANWDGWASIELVEGSIKTVEQFNATYKLYIDVARQLMDEVGGDYNVDDGSASGIETHNYISKTGRGSDHIDPLPFLQKWGVSYAKLKYDMVNGVKTMKPVQPTGTKGMQAFKNNPNYLATKAFKIDAVKTFTDKNGKKSWKIINHALAGGKDYDWKYNGIDSTLVERVDADGNVAKDQTKKAGDMVRFKAGYNEGTVDHYDNASNGVGIYMKNGVIWFNSDALFEL